MVETGRAPSAGDGPVKTSPTYRVALLSRRRTDVLLAGIRQWPTGVFADPTTVEGRAAWYSFAFWLRTAAGAKLDVDPQELEAGLRSFAECGRARGQAFLCDRLENGAGYCCELGRMEQFADLLARANPAHLYSIAADWMDVEEAADRPAPRGLECDTSCNRCLRDYANPAYHGLLDGRLALDMARLATSTAEVVDLDAPWGSRENPWRRLCVGPQAPIPATLARLGYGPPVDCAGLRGCIHQGDRRRGVVERHPLWQDDHPAWVATRSAGLAGHTDYEEITMNPFHLLRRPADYV